MNTEETVSPVAETQNPAPEVVVPEVTTPEAVAETTAPVEPEEGEADKALKRMQRRIDKRTADVYRERARAEQLANELESLKARAGQEVEQQSSDPVLLAREISRIERFTEKANDIVSRGTKDHTDFKEAVLGDLIQEVGPLVLKNGAPSPFMEVVLESEKPEALLYHLGKNPDLAAELTGLSVTQLARKLDRIERDMASALKPKQSNAPKPLEPVKSAGSNSKDPANMTDREFAIWRHSQIKSRGVV